MEKSVVSILQERLQQRGFGAPRYDYERLGGPQHCPQFRCTAKTVDSVFVSATCKSKKEARLDVARAALCSLFPDALCHVADQAEYVLPDDFNTVVMVDLENVEVPRSIAFDNTTAVFGFCTASHPQAQNQRLRTIMCVETTPSTLPDAADTLMTMFVGQMIARKRRCTFKLVSGDHFAKTLADVLELRGYSAEWTTHL